MSLEAAVRRGARRNVLPSKQEVRVPLAGHFAIPYSNYIKGIEWLSERFSYPESEVKGDSFPMTWADDDEIYAAAGDPGWGETTTGLDVEKFSGYPPDYKITKANPMNDYLGFGGDGPKPTGLICINGILYLAFQNLRGSRKPAFGFLSQHGSDAHIVYAKAVWPKIWVPALRNIASPMFPGHKFGGPAFVNFGRNNANARDSYVYAVSPDQWDNGSNLRLGRVPIDEITERGAWEWVCAFTPSGEPAWSDDLDESIPVLSLHRWLGAPDMVYLASIQRYLLLTWRLHQDFSPTDGSDLIVLEAPEPWGPFSLVHYEEYWESQEVNPYSPRLPLKWIEADGITGWLQFSGNWGPAGQQAGYYRSHVRRFRLKMA
jgi:hypothetical protein